MKVLAAYPFEWEKLDREVKIQGILLTEGTWTGLDNEPVFYPKEVIQEARNTILGKPIKCGHVDIAEGVCGFFTGVKPYDGGVMVEGIIFTPEVVEAIEEGRLNYLSMEGLVTTAKEDSRIVAKEIYFTGAALTENPACPLCRVSVTQPVRLESRSKDRKERKVVLMEEFAEKKPTPAEFFKWIEDQLKGADIPADMIEKVMDILKKAIKVPYPYPSAYPQPKGEELEKPSRAQFLRWFRKQLKDLGLSAEDVNKVMGLIKRAIKTPYPYPYPQPKKGESEMEETFEELEREIEEKDEKIQELESTIETLRKSLKMFQDKVIEALIGEIKTLDEKFDATKMLEGVTDFETKKAILSAYLESLKRLRPPETQISVSAENPIEVRVKKELEKMFGTSDVKQIIESE
ncbi:MAG: hypothetical protein ACTSYJ_11485 [Candidatus Thorarchaeota archaeon]